MMATAFLATPAVAVRKDGCAKGETCRYDATKDPECWCGSTSIKSLSPRSKGQMRFQESQIDNSGSGQISIQQRL